MPFWNQKIVNNQLVWKSQSCYLICTTGATSIYATKRADARWANNNTGNAHLITNNPNQAVFPGGSMSFGVQPPDAPLDIDTQHVATTEFLEEAGLQTVSLGNGHFQLRTGVNAVVSTASRATFYHGRGFHAILLWFNSEMDLDTIAAAINGNILVDNNRYLSAIPAPINGYIRSDDELAGVTVANHVTTDWISLFDDPNQSWFLELFNDVINI
jgi:8-oxo-dGTP pyrophosphatase MutT (NUDIX family)